MREVESAFVVPGHVSDQLRHQLPVTVGHSLVIIEVQ
jgi:hypothetical protein